MKVSKCVSGKNSKMNYFTSDDLGFLCEMRSEGGGREEGIIIC